jgi:hypothetical protein
MNPQNSSTQSANTGGFEPGGSATDVSGTLSETKNKITQTARDAASKVKGAAGNTTARAKEEAARFAADKKEATASRIGSYSSAMHDTAQSLEEKDPNIAWFTHRAADRLQHVAEYMRNRDFAALRQDAEDMARRHPGAFYGGMFLAGLVVGNLVKASRSKLRENDSGGDMGYESNWSRRQRESEMGQPELSDAERAAAGI